MSPSHILREGEDMSTGAFFKFAVMIRCLHAGPLGVHIDAYVALLQEQGYARQSARVHLQVLADFSRGGGGIDVGICVARSPVGMSFI